MQNDIIAQLKAQYTDMSYRVDELNTALKIISERHGEFGQDYLTALLNVVYAYKQLVSAYYQQICALYSYIHAISKLRFKFWSTELHSQVVDVVLGLKTPADLKETVRGKSLKYYAEYMQLFRYFCYNVHSESEAADRITHPEYSFAYFKHIIAAQCEYVQIDDFDCTYLALSEIDCSTVDFDLYRQTFERICGLKLAQIAFFHSYLFRNTASIVQFAKLAAFVCLENQNRTITYKDVLYAYFLITAHDYRQS